MTSAATERAALAAIGQDLIDVAGDPGERRAAGLLGPVPERAAAGFADLATVPDWLRLPRNAQRHVAVRAALLAMAPALAASIDGEWLGDLSRRIDDATLDWAIERAPAVPGTGHSAIPADAVEVTGFALLRSALPAALAAYLDWAPGVDVVVPPALAAFCVPRAAEGVA